VLIITLFFHALDEDGIPRVIISVLFILLPRVAGRVAQSRLYHGHPVGRSRALKLEMGHGEVGGGDSETKRVWGLAELRMRA